MEFTKGNIFLLDVEAIVNPVNCVGVMGKGLAAQFKRKYPENFKVYERACKHKEVVPGRMFIVETGSSMNPLVIVNFPTKRHWRDTSRLDDISEGLLSLSTEVRERKIQSIAIPPLGCGLGGLNWKDVRPLIELSFRDFHDTRIVILEP